MPFAGHRLVGSSRSFRTLAARDEQHAAVATRVPEIRPWHRNLRKWGEATDGQVSSMQIFGLSSRHDATFLD